MKSQFPTAIVTGISEATADGSGKHGASDSLGKNVNQNIDFPGNFLRELRKYYFEIILSACCIVGGLYV